MGVNIEMTPTVHFDHDVTLKIKIEVSSQSGSVTISGVTEPILSQRVVDQVIRLREGEASILGGIQDNRRQQSWTGIPGLSSIPILKYLFGSKDHTIQRRRDRLSGGAACGSLAELDQANLRTVDTGEGQSIELRHVENAAPAPAALQRASGRHRSSPSPVPFPARAPAEPRRRRCQYGHSHRQTPWQPPPAALEPPTAASAAQHPSPATESASRPATVAAGHRQP